MKNISIWFLWGFSVNAASSFIWIWGILAWFCEFIIYFAHTHNSFYVGMDKWTGRLSLMSLVLWLILVVHPLRCIYANMEGLYIFFFNFLFTIWVFTTLLIEFRVYILIPFFLVNKFEIFELGMQLICSGRRGILL